MGVCLLSQLLCVYPWSWWDWGCLCSWLYVSFIYGVPGMLSCCQFSSVQSLSPVRLFVTPWIAARQASLSITKSRSLFRLMPIESVMPSSHLILCRPLLLLPSIPPASGSSPMSQLTICCHSSYLICICLTAFNILGEKDISMTL